MRTALVHFWLFFITGILCSKWFHAKEDEEDWDWVNFMRKDEDFFFVINEKPFQARKNYCRAFFSSQQHYFTDHWNFLDNILRRPPCLYCIWFISFSKLSIFHWIFPSTFNIVDKCLEVSENFPPFCLSKFFSIFSATNTISTLKIP